MGPLLALGASLTFGVEDFLAALAARRTSALTVALGLQIVGLIVLVPIVLLAPGQPSVRAVALGALAGLLGTAGLVVYLRSMARGPIGVVSPIAAITGAGLPVAWGVAVAGDALGVAQFIGIAAGLAAVALVAASPTGRPHGEPSAGVWAALTAGLGFGAFFIVLDGAPQDSGLWPLVGARIASAIGVITLLRFVSRPAPPRDALPFIAIAGVSGMAANALFLLATRIGVLSLASLLSSLYPVVALLLARAFLEERLRRPQALGAALAMCAVVLIVTG
ncbi:MAG: hypothetical protein RLZZ272_88 [Actinomycetota bacterium]